MLCSLLALAPLFFQGCATTAPVRGEAPHERNLREKKMGNELSVRLEHAFKVRHLPKVEAYLSGIAGRLAAQDSEFKEVPLSVILIEDFRQHWESFALPGGRIYLPIGLLKKFEYDNEAAALLAIELSHLKRRDLVRKIQSGAANSANLFGPEGVFAFDDETLVSAAGGAVEFMYGAGFDSRGLVSLLERLSESGTSSPYDKDLLARMLEQVRAEIAQRTPLRNPIVRTQQFQEFKKQMVRIQD